MPKLAFNFYEMDPWNSTNFCIFKKEKVFETKVPEKEFFIKFKIFNFWKLLEISENSHETKRDFMNKNNNNVFFSNQVHNSVSNI